MYFYIFEVKHLFFVIITLMALGDTNVSAEMVVYTVNGCSCIIRISEWRHLEVEAEWGVRLIWVLFAMGVSVTAKRYFVDTPQIVRAVGVTFDRITMAGTEWAPKYSNFNKFVQWTWGYKAKKTIKLINEGWKPSQTTKNPTGSAT